MNLLYSISIVLIFAFVIFLSAALMFILEPMVAKLLLPLLGGSGNVWNTCVFFFQTILLLGYLYAHTLNKLKLSPKLRAMIHLTIVWLPLFSLPMHSPGQAPSDDVPYVWLLCTLVSTIGGVFFALSTTAPLLQKWYTNTRGPSSKDPYFLYAASNLGSLLGLLSYPIIIEPRIGLLKQSELLTFCYLVFAALITVCTAFYSFASSKEAELNTEDTSGKDSFPPSKKQYAQWLFLAMLPASMVLGLTTYITNMMGAFPMFWLIPLSLYILSFVIAFSRFSPRLISLLTYLAVPLLLWVLYSMYDVEMFGDDEQAYYVFIGLNLQLPVLFLVGLICHGKIAQERPQAKYLTNYFLCIALGGMLGSSINTFIAPLLFTEFAEYPLILALTTTTFAGMLKLGKLSIPKVAIPWVVIASGLLIMYHYTTPEESRAVLTVRNFYGQVRVHVDPENCICEILDGITIHGGQSIDPQDRDLPIFYFCMKSPLWTLLQELTSSIGLKKCGVVGMGAGTMAAYAAPGQSMVFYELNPAVIELATNPFYFTYIYDAIKRNVKIDIEEGDGRLNLSKEADKQFSLLLIDAYSNESMPLHLMTREAIKMYHSKLVDGGAMAFNVTSNYFDNNEILSKGAHSLNLEAVSLNDYDKEGDEEPYEARSSWVVISSDKNLIRKLKENSKWKDIPFQPETRIWTDDYCDLKSALIKPKKDSKRLRVSPNP